MATDISRIVQNKCVWQRWHGLSIATLFGLACLLSACATQPPPKDPPPLTAYQKRSVAFNALQSYGIPVINRGNQMDVLIPNDLLFDVNATNFAPSAYPILEDLYEAVHTYHLSTLQIHGLTQPTMTHNGLLLTRARAGVVAHQLWQNGLSHSVPLIYGALQPTHQALDSITRDVHGPVIWVHWRYYITPRKFD